MCAIPILLEACGMLEGMRLAKTMGWERIIMESDYLKLVEDLRSFTDIDSEPGTVYRNIWI